MYLFARESVGSTLDVVSRRHDRNQRSALGEGGVPPPVVSGADDDDWHSFSCEQCRVSIDLYRLINTTAVSSRRDDYDVFLNQFREVMLQYALGQSSRVRDYQVIGISASVLRPFGVTSGHRMGY